MVSNVQLRVSTHKKRSYRILHKKKKKIKTVRKKTTFIDVTVHNEQLALQYHFAARRYHSKMVSRVSVSTQRKTVFSILYVNTLITQLRANTYDLKKYLQTIHGGTGTA